jgi:hypothetical protein
MPGFRGGVGGEIVQHDVDLFARVGFDCILESGPDVLAVAGGRALAQHFAGADVQRREQVDGAVPDVAVGAFLRCIEVDRQQRLGAVRAWIWVFSSRH